MADALDVLRLLSQQLGRDPSLEELYLFLSSNPSGTPAAPPTPQLPSLREPELGVGPAAAHLTAWELMQLNPEIGKAREQLLRSLLFGDLGGPPGLLQRPMGAAPRSPVHGGGHGLPFLP